ncbi:MAG: hypothetical protein GY810_27660 [Aureispira sp.]|nr:hypothetical protein [Aureispira sp.]
MRKLYICISSLIIMFLAISKPQGVLAQNSKIVTAYEKGDYEKCLKLSEKASSKDLEPILYNAMVWAKYSTISPVDKSYRAEYQGAIKKALKSLASLKRKDRPGTFIKAHLEEYHFVRSRLLEDAHEYAKAGSIERALLAYEAIMNQLQDKGVYFYTGCSWIEYNDVHLGMRYLNMGLKNYYYEFKSKGIRPEPEVLEYLLKATEQLSEKGLYMHAISTFGFMDLIYSRATEKGIDKAFLKCLKLAMNDIKPDDHQLTRLLREHEEAVKKYPKEKEIKEWKANFIENALNGYIKTYSASTENLAKVESSYRFVLDSLEQPAIALQQINTGLLSNIHQLYKEGNDDKKRKKSLALYDLFCSISNDYDKKESAALKCVDYGFQKNDLRSQSTGILIYRTKEKDLTKIADKMKALEERMIKKASTMGDSYTEFDEVIYWLKNFPKMVALKAELKGYFEKYSKTLLDKNQFSKAGLFLLRAQEYFPEEKEFKTLKRACVEKDYKINYIGSEFAEKELNWTGSVATCTPGKISKVAQEKIIQRYDFVRRLLGFPDGTILDPEENKYCQAGALCMSAQGELSHNPDKSWKCYSKNAARGAHNSLGIGFSCSESILEMIEDSGPNNKATGHRGNLLTPHFKSFVYGATNNTVALSAGSKERHNDEALDRFDTDFVSWPPRGPIPAHCVFNRWSFKSYNRNFSFENAEVKMYVDGKAIELDLEYETTMKIGWVPEGIDRNLKKDQTVKVVVELDAKRGYGATPKREKFEYEVIIYPISK